MGIGSSVFQSQSAGSGIVGTDHATAIVVISRTTRKIKIRPLVGPTTSKIGLIGYGLDLAVDIAGTSGENAPDNR